MIRQSDIKNDRVRQIVSGGQYAVFRRARHDALETELVRKVDENARKGHVVFDDQDLALVGIEVIAIIGRSAVRLLPITLGRDRMLWGIAVTCAFTTAWLERESVILFVGCGLFAVAWQRRAVPGAPAVPVVAGAWLGGGAVPAVQQIGHSLLPMLLYFAGAGFFVFGSGLAIVPFLHGGVVERAV